MLSKRKRIVILGGMVLLLVITGVVNILLNTSNAGNTSGTDGTVLTGNYFVDFKATRTKERNNVLLSYKGIVESSSYSQEAKDSAEVATKNLLKLIETEGMLEGMLEGLGFSGVAVMIGSTNVYAIVEMDMDPASAEAQKQATQIMTSIMDELEIAATRIIITPYPASKKAA